MIKEERKRYLVMIWKEKEKGKREKKKLWNNEMGIIINKRGKL